MSPAASPLKQQPANDQAAQKIAYATEESAPKVPGRRTFFTYRDLGVAGASHGRIKAQTMTAITGMTEPTGWHYHVCEGQFVYALKGWVDLEFETGETIHLRQGESLYIPGGMKHNEIATSDDLEILEILVPGDMTTVACDKPT